MIPYLTTDNLKNRNLSQGPYLYSPSMRVPLGQQLRIGSENLNQDSEVEVNLAGGGGAVLHRGCPYARKLRSKGVPCKSVGI